MNSDQQYLDEFAGSAKAVQLGATVVVGRASNADSDDSALHVDLTHDESHGNEEDLGESDYELSDDEDAAGIAAAEGADLCSPGADSLVLSEDSNDNDDPRLPSNVVSPIFANDAANRQSIALQQAEVAALADELSDVSDSVYFGERIQRDDSRSEQQDSQESSQSLLLPIFDDVYIGQEDPEPVLKQLYVDTNSAAQLAEVDQARIECDQVDPHLAESLRVFDSKFFSMNRYYHTKYKRVDVDGLRTHAQNTMVLTPRGSNIASTVDLGGDDLSSGRDSNADLGSSAFLDELSSSQPMSPTRSPAPLSSSSSPGTLPARTMSMASMKKLPSVSATIAGAVPTLEMDQLSSSGSPRSALQSPLIEQLQSQGTLNSPRVSKSSSSSPALRIKKARSRTNSAATPTSLDSAASDSSGLDVDTPEDLDEEDVVTAAPGEQQVDVMTKWSRSKEQMDKTVPLPPDPVEDIVEDNSPVPSRRLLSLQQPNYKWTDIAAKLCNRQDYYKFQAKRPLRFTLQPQELKFEHTFAEPLFCRVAIFDAEAQRKVTEDFHFYISQSDTIKMLPKTLGFEIERATKKRCLFSVVDFTPSMYLVVFVERVLTSGTEDAIKAYQKDLSQKDQRKIVHGFLDRVDRMGYIRQPFLWGFAPLMQSGMLLTGVQSITPMYELTGNREQPLNIYEYMNGNIFKKQKPRQASVGFTFIISTSTLSVGLAEAALAIKSPRRDRTLDGRKLLDHYGSPIVSNRQSDVDLQRESDAWADDPATEADQYGPDEDTLRDTDSFREVSRLDTDIDYMAASPLPSASSLSHVADGVFRAEQLPGSYYISPFLNFVHNLFVSPVQVSFQGVPKVRNVMVEVSLRNDDSDIKDLSTCEERFVSWYLADKRSIAAASSVQYHEKSPVFFDEFKIELPTVISEKHHLLFTFYNVRCDEDAPKKGQVVVTGDEDGKGELYGPAERTVLGYSFMPLLQDNYITLDKLYSLPVYKELKSQYLQLYNPDGSPCERLELVTKNRFDVSTRLLSSLFPNEARVKGYINVLREVLMLVQTKEGIPQIKYKTKDLKDAVKQLKNSDFAVLQPYIPVLLNETFDAMQFIADLSAEIAPGMLNVLLSGVLTLLKGQTLLNKDQGRLGSFFPSYVQSMFNDRDSFYSDMLQDRDAVPMFVVIPRIMDDYITSHTSTRLMSMNFGQQSPVDLTRKNTGIPRMPSLYATFKKQPKGRMEDLRKAIEAAGSGQDGNGDGSKDSSGEYINHTHLMHFSWFFFDIMIKSMTLYAKNKIKESEEIAMLGATLQKRADAVYHNNGWEYGEKVTSSSSFKKSAPATPASLNSSPAHTRESSVDVVSHGSSSSEEIGGQRFMHARGFSTSSTAGLSPFIDQFSTDFKKLLETFTKQIARMTNSSRPKEGNIARMANRQLALFFSDLIPILPRSQFLAILDSYMTGMRSSDVKTLRLKIEFFQILVDYRDFMSINHPGNADFGNRITRHFLDVVFEAIQRTEQQNDEKALKLLMSHLAKMDFDARYQDESCKQLVAEVYLPFVDRFLAICDFQTLAILQKEDAQLQLFTCMLWILRNLKKRQLIAWWNIQTIDTIQRVFSIFERCAVLLVQGDGIRTVVREQATLHLLYLTDVFTTRLRPLINDIKAGNLDINRLSPDMQQAMIDMQMDEAAAAELEEANKHQNTHVASIMDTLCQYLHTLVLTCRHHEKHIYYFVFEKLLRRFIELYRDDIIVVFRSKATRVQVNRLERKWQLLVGSIFTLVDHPMDETTHPVLISCLRMLIDPMCASATSADTAQADANEEDIAYGDEGYIKAASLDNLIHRLVVGGKDKESFFNKVFLLTYYSFVKPVELFRRLFAFYRCHTDAAIRLRIFSFVSDYIKFNFHDLNNECIALLVDFLDDKHLVQKHKAAHTKVKRYLSRELLGLRTQNTNVLEPPPPPEVPDNFNIKEMEKPKIPLDQVSRLKKRVFGSNPFDRPFDLMEWPSVEIARQMTLIEQDLFKKIEPKECFGLAWSKKDKKDLAPNIVAMQERFNKVNGWVQRTIVSEPDLKKRQVILLKFIEVLRELRKLNNFSTINQICSALNSAAIFRMKQTFAVLKKDDLKVFTQYCTLFEKPPFFELRQQLQAAAGQPAVPFLGAYQTELTFIEDGNRDTLPHPTKPGVELINFSKRRLYSEAIMNIQMYQQTPYNLIKLPYLNYVLTEEIFKDLYDDETLYKRSLKLEERAKS